MKKYMIEREIPKIGTLEQEQVRKAAAKSNQVLQQLGPVTLSARIGGSSLTPEKYTEAGGYIYGRDVPASALSGDSVSVEFTTDKAIPAGKIEKRELALIVTSVGLVSK